MMWLRRLILGLPIALLCFFALAFFSVRVAAPRRLNQFVAGSIGEPETLNPILSTTTAAAEVEGRIFNGLIRYDENLDVEGDLAESWTIRQTTRLFFGSAGEAAIAAGRIRAHRSEWPALSLEAAEVEENVLRLEFATAGTSYRQDLLGWLGEQEPMPVTFVSVQLKTERSFPDGAPARSEEMLARLERLLQPRPDLERRIIYTWTGSASGYAELAMFGPTGEIEGLIKYLLSTSDEESALGECKAGEPEPALDEPEIVFKLRRGVLWHDGEPFTAADVKFTYEMLMSESVASPRRSDYELIREVTAPDDYTVRVVYKRPYAPALLSWGMSVLPAHILRGKSTDWWAKNFNRSPIGTGPFRFGEWRVNETITLLRNPDYWQGSPHLDRIVLRFIPDTLALRLSFETGEVDVLGVQPHALGTMRDDPRYEIFSRLVPMYTFVGWNLERPLFQDRRVRRALAHGVNVPQIIEYILYGQGIQSNGTFPPQMWFADPDLMPYRYDPTRARELLAEAGWSDSDGDGWLDRDGQRFAFTLITNQGNEIRKDIATLVQGDLKKLGIRVDVEIYEWAVFIRDKIDAHDFDACVLGWSLGYDYDQYQLWHSSQAVPGGLNFCSYRNERVDRLLELARGEFDREKAKQYCHEIQRIIYEDQPYLFLYVPKGTTALHRGAFRVRRPDGRGGWIDEPIRSTKAGIGIYDTWWYRTALGPGGARALVP